ncbi:outer membrane beta-barrel protein [Prosthecochloris sp.]|uniref:outer membrane protein n=1 Tax=Prosthecochloris sp. TaxID=290513 RepID=UPI002579DA98|nr:outer membrane beta-barrel protein [Prosthecochloris sp.]
MKKALSLLMVFLVAVMWSAPGFSADKYVSGSIGINWMSDADLEPDFDYDYDDYDLEAGFDSGITLLGAFGCDYGDYRLEGELGYQSGDVDSLEFSGEDGEYDDISGDVTILSLLVNGYYDIDLGGGFELSPTVGVGVAQVKADDVELYDNAPDWSVSEVTFAYQAGIGLGIPVSDGIMLDARYRYFGTTDFTVEFSDYQFNTNMESHSALLGLRVNL